MLVRVKPGADISGAEQEFVDCLRKYPTPALALTDLRVGDNRGTRRVDAVVFTPRGLTVLHVLGFRRRQSGILNIAADGAWTISDTPADLDDTRTGSPTDELEQSVFEVRSALERALLDPGHVCGAVVLVPFRGVVVRPARTNLRPGLDVVVGNVSDATDLRIYLEGFSAGPRNWTADRVVSACKALGLSSDAPSRDELLADGFETVAPESPTSIAREVKPREPSTPRPPSDAQRILSWLITAVAVVGILILVGVVAVALATDTAHPAPERTSVVPSPTPSPAPYRPVQCWPFQPGC
ncbi:nuclease-related domain-containing protein [Nocardia arthritidis]|uniref:NERD domain-containing protein n=1 Tax=Nocardia arthritidis TaxID=228602 RepID=A0A6G9YST6_9NOCA|nr:nuclease-related domain-containing protein [Nocardia arthritidis]QIS16190.1 NERD domain-containing protein [Nocardia arthritidis]